MLNSYLNEYEQWEALKKWWQKYNAVIIVAFSLILLSLSGYKYWNWHQEKKMVQASNTYEHMMLAAANHEPKLIVQYAKDLVEQFPDSIYSDAARLSLAKLAVSNHEYDKAEAELKWVAEHSKTSELADVARIRLARLWFGHKDYNKALHVLKEVHSKVYLPLVDELKGDIYTAMSQFDKAVDFYRKALSEVQNYGVGNLFLEMKSNDLAPTTNTQAITQVALKK